MCKHLSVWASCLCIKKVAEPDRTTSISATQNYFHFDFALSFAFCLACELLVDLACWDLCGATASSSVCRDFHLKDQRVADGVDSWRGANLRSGQCQATIEKVTIALPAHSPFVCVFVCVWLYFGPICVKKKKPLNLPKKAQKLNRHKPRLM